MNIILKFTTENMFQAFKEGFDVYAAYCKNGKIVTLQEFQQFLCEVQKDPLGKNEQNVSQFMRDFLQVFSL